LVEADHTSTGPAHVGCCGLVLGCQSTRTDDLGDADGLVAVLPLYGDAENDLGPVLSLPELGEFDGRP
jgi:hypothetical protein